MILGYLDISGRNMSVAEQRRIIEQYASAHICPVDLFGEYTDVAALDKSLQTLGHKLFVANIAALGTSLNAVIESIQRLSKKDFSIYSVKEDIYISPETASKIISGLEQAITIRQSIVSIITRNALDKRKNQGVKLGRKTPNKKRKLEGDELIIKERLRAGCTKMQLAADLGVSQTLLYAFLQKHPELKPQT